MMQVRLEARTVFLILLACIALLTVAGFFVVFARFGLDHGRLLGISGRFDLNGEGNVPAYYSALQIAFAALLLAVIARAKRAGRDRYARHWVVLCVIFIFLSFDEAAELHERLREPMLARFELTGIWVYAWYIPYGILVALFGVSYWRFFWHLTRPYSFGVCRRRGDLRWRRHRPRAGADLLRRVTGARAEWTAVRGAELLG
jgi:hypothetical protein